MWRRKSVPAWLGEELVPEVDGRAPRAARTAGHGAKAVARVGGTCGPSGSSGWRSVGLGFVSGFALLEPEALGIHLEDMDVMGQAGIVRPICSGARKRQAKLFHASI